MNIKSFFAIFGLCLVLTPGKLLACANHMYINPNELGFFGNAMVRMAGLAPPQKVFTLDHPVMVKSDLGEKHEITVKYTRPFFSKDVRMQLKATENVELGETVIPLEAREGAVTIPYELVDAGIDSITLTVSGQHKGEVVREITRIYVGANTKQSKPAVMVSGR